MSDAAIKASLLDATRSRRPDREEAKRFLKALDPTATRWTFQIFDDDKERKKARAEENKQRKQAKQPLLKDPFAKFLHGALDEHFDELARLNAQRAGIFVTVNETDFNGRSEENIVRVRALFVDLDGSPIEPVRSDEKMLKPHIVVESSPGRWHTYWLIGFKLKAKNFTAAQKKLIARYHGDEAINDLPRVMRLPGFYHCKVGEPQLVKVLETADRAPYAAREMAVALAGLPEPTKAEKKKTQTTGDAGPLRRRLNDAAMANLSSWVPALFPDAAEYKGGYRVTSAALNRDNEEDLSIMPEGIKDFGVHDMGDEREGKRTPVELVMEHKKADFAAASAWLRKQLGLPEGVTLDDFYAYMPAHDYIFTPTRETWPGTSIDSRIAPVVLPGILDRKGKPVKISASKWLDQHRSVEQMTWAPGLPMVIADRLIENGVWIDRSGVSCFNLYQPPTIIPGDAGKAEKWLDHQDDLSRRLGTHREGLRPPRPEAGGGDQPRRRAWRRARHW
jgi:hypothetical protein